MFEAAPFHGAELRRIESSASMVQYAAASNQIGEVAFHLDPDTPNGGGASTQSTSVHAVIVPCTAINAAVEARGLESPYLIKLDAQGHERAFL